MIVSEASRVHNSPPKKTRWGGAVISDEVTTTTLGNKEIIDNMCGSHNI